MRESTTDGRKFENSDALFKHDALSGLYYGVAGSSGLIQEEDNYPRHNHYT